jgi:hypothetical protein
LVLIIILLYCAMGSKCLVAGGVGSTSLLLLLFVSIICAVACCCVGTRCSLRFICLIAVMCKSVAHIYLLLVGCIGYTQYTTMAMGWFDTQ